MALNMEIISSLFTFPALKDMVVAKILFASIRSETGTLNIVNTDANGAAQIDSIDHDRYTVTFNVPTFRPVNIDKDVDTGTNARLTVKLVAI